ncbi:hypothetical protein J4467_03600 [Candidatus Woesearchaeota archaeon]|nr:hypothetical protein [Candidatus Woesearchaeota archaeon]
MAELTTELIQDTYKSFRLNARKCGVNFTHFAFEEYLSAMIESAFSGFSIETLEFLASIDGYIPEFKRSNQNLFPGMNNGFEKAVIEYCGKYALQHKDDNSLLSTIKMICFASGLEFLTDKADLIRTEVDAEVMKINTRLDDEYAPIFKKVFEAIEITDQELLRIGSTMGSYDRGFSPRCIGQYLRALCSGQSKLKEFERTATGGLIKISDRLQFERDVLLYQAGFPEELTRIDRVIFDKNKVNFLDYLMLRTGIPNGDKKC